MANYPSSLWVPTTKTDKVDLVSASHINTAQDEIVAVQTEIGLLPKGNQLNLVERLAVMMDLNGAFAQGSAYPASTYSGQPFYRTDTDLFYIRDAADSAWGLLSGTLSSELFSWSGHVDAVTDVVGVFTEAYTIEGVNANEITGQIQSANYDGHNFLFQVYGSTLQTVLRFRFRKLSSINNVIIHSYSRGGGASNDCITAIDIGGGTITGQVDTNNTSAFAWFESSAIDVSGLTNSNDYEVLIQIKGESSSTNGYLGAVTIEGTT